MDLNVLQIGLLSFFVTPHGVTEAHRQIAAASEGTFRETLKNDAQYRCLSRGKSVTMNSLSYQMKIYQGGS